MNRIECPFEEVLRSAGYVQTYDGQTAMHKATEQFGLQPAERRYFVRRYQKVRNNRFVNRWATLKYDMRSNFCVECNISNKLSNGARQEQTMLSREENPSKLKFVEGA